jgi:hypothetical protein
MLLNGSRPWYSARRHWLQKGQTVQNPLYGKAISECGRLIDGMPTLTK